MPGLSESHSVSTILEDDRKIRAVHNDEAQISWSVGSDGVTKIVAYYEKGQMAWVPYIAIHKGNEITERMSAHHLRIQYEPTS